MVGPLGERAPPARSLRGGEILPQSRRRRQTPRSPGQQTRVAANRHQDHRAALVDDVEVTGRGGDESYRAFVADDGREHGADLPVGADGADQAVSGIGDEYATVRRDSDAARRVETRAWARSVAVTGRGTVAIRGRARRAGPTVDVAGRAPASGKASARERRAGPTSVSGVVIVATGERADLPVRVDHSDAVVVGVGDDDASRGVHGDAHRRVEPRLRRGAIDVTGDAVTCNRRDGATRADTPDRMIAGVGDHERAVRRERKARGRGKPRLAANTIRESTSATGNRRHRTVDCDLADAMRRAGVAHEDPPVRRGSQPERL